MAIDLLSLKSQEREPGTPPMPREEAEGLMPQLADRWRVAPDVKSLEAEITFKDFVRAMGFLNRLADLAEREGHHPDFCLRGWNKVSLKLYTHTVGGLSMNDFIMAAKLDRVVSPPAGEDGA